MLTYANLFSTKFMHVYEHKHQIDVGSISGKIPNGSKRC